MRRFIIVAVALVAISFGTTSQACDLFDLLKRKACCPAPVVVCCKPEPVCCPAPVVVCCKPKLLERLAQKIADLRKPKCEIVCCK